MIILKPRDNEGVFSKFTLVKCMTSPEFSRVCTHRFDVPAHMNEGDKLKVPKFLWKMNRKFFLNGIATLESYFERFNQTKGRCNMLQQSYEALRSCGGEPRNYVKGVEMEKQEHGMR